MSLRASHLTSSLLTSLLFTSILSGCNFPFTPAGSPGLLPSEQIPTVIAMTLEAQGILQRTGTPAAETQVETALATGEPVTPTVALQATQAATQPAAVSPPTQTAPPPDGDSNPPAGVPTGVIQFLNPGPGSLVTSPFLVRSSVRPGPNATVRLELLGEDGRLLMREVKTYDVPPNQGVLIGQEIAFAINAVAETARFQIIVEDENGQLAAIASLDLLLLSLGNPDLNQPGDDLENIVISEPKQNTLIQGSVMRVSGIARLRNPQPLLIELRTSDGKIVGTRQVAVVPIPGSSYGTYAIDVPYSVDRLTRVRVAAWETGVDIPGIVHLSSLEVMLSP